MMNKSQIILVIGSIFVFAMFLSTYFTFTNNNSPTAPAASKVQNSTSLQNCTGVFATNDTNAIIVNYSNNFIVSVNKSLGINQISSNTAIISNDINSTLNKLNASGEISFLVLNNTTYHVLALKNITAYSMQNVISNNMQSDKIASNAIEAFTLFSISSISYANLPSILSFRAYSQQFTQREILKNRQYNLSIYPILPINAVVPVTVQGMISSNGLCQGSIRIISRPAA